MQDLKTIRKLVEYDRQELLMRFPFLGRIICSSELVIVPSADLKMASTDYRHIFLSAENYPELPEEMRLAVLAHEVLHIALRHAFRIGSRERKRFEQAADIEVENLMPKSLHTPYSISAPCVWKNLTAEEIYELLIDNHWLKKCPLSEHCMPEDEVDDSEEALSNGQSAMESLNDDASPSKKSSISSEECSAQETSDVASYESANGTRQELEEPGISIGKFSPQFEDTAEANCRMLWEEMRMDMESRTDINPVVEALKKRLLKPEKGKLNWRVLLRQYLQVCRGGSYTWNIPNRRFIGRGLYLPGRQSKRFCGVVALDVSGSMEWNLPLIFGELVSLLRSFDHYELDVLQCDTKITDAQHFNEHHPFTYENVKIIQSTGCNRFSPVFDYIQQKQIRPNVLIYLTDGYLFTEDRESPPKHGPPYPVLWMLTKDGERPVSWGKVIFIKEDM